MSSTPSVDEMTLSEQRESIPVQARKTRPPPVPARAGPLMLCSSRVTLLEKLRPSAEDMTLSEWRGSVPAQHSCSVPLERLAMAGVPIAVWLRVDLPLSKASVIVTGVLLSP